MNPAGFHMDNLFLHAANSILLFWVLRALTGKRSLALLAVALFAVHPIHVESVSWATSRKDVLSHFFAFASFLVYVNGKQKTRGGYMICVVAATLLLLLGMMAKPTVGVLPAVILMSDLLMGAKPVPWKRIFFYQTICLGSLVIYMFLTFPMTLGGAVKPEIHLSPVEHLGLFLDLYGFFVKLILFPVNLSAFYLINVSGTIYSVMVLVYIPCLLAAVYWIFAAISRSLKERTMPDGNSQLAWATATYLFGLLPFTNILPRTIYLADRYEYLASVGFCFAVSILLLEINKAGLRVSAAGTLIVLYSVLSMDRIPVWKNSSTLWADTDHKRNTSRLEHHKNMANAYGFEGQWGKAVQEYESAGIDNVTDAETLLRISKIYMTAGQKEQAEQLLEKTINRYPQFFPAIHELIMWNIGSKDYRKAEDLLRFYEDRFEEKESVNIRNLIRYDKEGDLEQASLVYRNLQIEIWKRWSHVRK